MEIDAEFRRQVLVSVFAVALFFAAAIWVGISENGADGLSPDGGLALLAVLTGFVILMWILGALLDRRSDDE